MILGLQRLGVIIAAFLVLCCSADSASAQPVLPLPPLALSLATPDATALQPGCNLLAPNSLTSRTALVRTFFDDFHDFEPGHTRWLLTYNSPGDPVAGHTHYNSAEQQVYVDPSYSGTAGQPLGINPFSFENGHLVIAAHRLDDQMRSVLHGRLYSSGMLQSSALFTQTYGYFEASIQIPEGLGLWPAFWMVPATRHSPPELDIIEILGRTPQDIYSTLHLNYNDPKNGRIGCKRQEPATTRRSVMYGVLWTPEVIVYFTDRVPAQAIRSDPSMRVPMFLILNLAEGGPWPGPVTPETPVDARMVVDWVAAYGLVN